VTRILVLLVGLSLGASALAGSSDPFGVLPSDPAAAWAQVSQRVLPSLAAGRETADRRVAARKAFFAGKDSLAAAFPDLVDARLGSDEVLRGRLVALDDAEVARAAERMAPLPVLDSARHRAALEAARTAALDAEDAADALERRLLLSLRAVGAAHPGLTDDGLKPLRESLDDALASAQEAARSADEQHAGAAAREVARIDAERARLERVVTTVRRAGLVQAAPRPNPMPELEELQRDVTEPWALERLALMEPFLAPSDVARVDAAERRWIAEVRLPALERDLTLALDAAPPEGLPDAERTTRMTAAEAAVRDAQDRLAATPGGLPGTVAALRHASADLEVRVAEARLGALQRAALPPADSAAATATTEAERARQEARQATTAAEVAREQAQGAQEIKIADLRAHSADAHQRAADAWEEARALEEALQESEAQRQQQLAALSDRVFAAEGRRRMGRAEIDATYADLRGFVEALRDDATAALQASDQERATARETRAQVAKEGDEIDAARSEVQAMADEDGRTAATEALDRWAAGLDDELRAREHASSVAEDHSDALLQMLRTAKKARRTLHPEVSRSERVKDRGALLVELGQELRLLPHHVISQLRGRLRTLIGLPRALLDFNYVTGLLRGSFFSLVLAFAWWLARGRTTTAASYLLARLRRADRRYRPADLLPLREPLDRFLVALVDWVLGWLLVGPVYDLLPELGFVLRSYLYLVTWRLLLALFDMAFVRHPDRRVGLLALSASNYDEGRRTLRWVAGWYLSRAYTEFVLLNVVGVDVLNRIFRFAFNWAGVAIAVRLLHEWQPLLQRRMTRMHQGSAVVRRLSGDPPHWSLRALYAIAILGYLAVASVWTLINRLARQREGLGRLLNVLSRYRMKGEERPEEQIPVPDDLVAALTIDGVAADAYVRREDVDDALEQTFGAWEKERRQGLVALVGDRGAGKTTTLDRFTTGIAKATGLRLVRGKVDRRLTRNGEALVWLSEIFAMPDPFQRAEDAIAALQAREPELIVLEHVEQAFLRTVNGFEGLQTLLYVLNACASTHFMVLSFHRPAWRYVSLLGGLVNTEVFRAVIQLPPMGEDALAQITQRRLEAAGWKPDFSELVGANPFGADPAVELERSTSVFYRLLAEASGGNPAIALDLFVRCITPELEAKTVRVKTDHALELDLVQGLSEPDLFTLVALRTQDSLDERELERVTNMAPGVVKSTVKHLEQRGLVVLAEGHVRILQSQLAAVTRTLRRRNFLQG